MKANIVYEFKPDGRRVFKFFTSDFAIAQVYRDSVRRYTAWKRTKADLVGNTIGIQPFEERTLEIALQKYGIEYTHDEFTLYTDIDHTNIMCDYTILFDRVTDPIKVLTSGGLHINPPKVHMSFQKYPSTDGEIYLLRDMNQRFYLTSCVTFNGADYERFNRMYSELVDYLDKHITVNRTYEEIIQMLKPVLNQYISN